MEGKFKTDLVAAVAAEVQEDPAVVQNVLDGVARVIVTWLAEGCRVTWTGFGVFDPRERISPLPGQQPFTTPAVERGLVRWILFRPSAYLRELLRQGGEERQ